MKCQAVQTTTVVSSISYRLSKALWISNLYNGNLTSIKPDNKVQLISCSMVVRFSCDSKQHAIKVGSKTVCSLRRENRGLLHKVDYIVGILK